MPKSKKINKQISGRGQIYKKASSKSAKYNDEIEEEKGFKKQKSNRKSRRSRDEDEGDDDISSIDDQSISPNNKNTRNNISARDNFNKKANSWMEDDIETGKMQGKINRVMSKNVDLNKQMQAANTRRSVAFNQIKYNQENLGEDFEDSPWVPPSVELVIPYVCSSN